MIAMLCKQTAFSGYRMTGNYHNNLHLSHYPFKLE